MKKLYKISQTVNNGYDTYSDAVVCAESEEKAKYIFPRIGGSKDTKWWKDNFCISYWSRPKDVHVEEIGIANDNIELGSVICSSFRAG
jgi:hypothetical protein